MTIQVCPPYGTLYVLVDHQADIGAHIDIATGEVRAWRASGAIQPVECAVLWL